MSMIELGALAGAMLSVWVLGTRILSLVKVILKYVKQLEDINQRQLEQGDQMANLIKEQAELVRQVADLGVGQRHLVGTIEALSTHLKQMVENLDDLSIGQMVLNEQIETLRATVHALQAGGRRQEEHKQVGMFSNHRLGGSK